MSGVRQLMVHLKHIGNDSGLGMPGLPPTAVTCVLESERSRADPGSEQQREEINSRETANYLDPAYF